MQKIISKSGLAMILSRLEAFQRPKVRVEQYTTDSETAAEVLWSAFMSGDIEKCVIVDLGCGTGILGMGALILGAERVYFIDIDKDAIDTAKNNILFLKSEGYLKKTVKESREFVFRCMDVRDISSFIEDEKVKDKRFKVDTVLQNPPFGTRIKHIDRLFIEKGLELAPVVYTFHKSSTEGFVKAYCRDAKVRITQVFRFDFPLKKTMAHHRKRIERIKVSCFRLERQ